MNVNRLDTRIRQLVHSIVVHLRRRQQYVLLGALFGLLTSMMPENPLLAASAISRTWQDQGGASQTQWPNSQNWVASNPANASDEQAVFPTSATAKETFIDYSSGSNNTIANIRFNSSGWSISQQNSASNLTLAGYNPGTDNTVVANAATSGTNTINAKLILGVNNGVFKTSSGGTTLISGVIDDGLNTYNIRKQFGGTLILGNANTYGGTTTIDDAGGTLKITNPLAVGTGNISIAKDGPDTGTLELALTGTNTISNTFNGFKSSDALDSSGTANILNTSGTNTITSDLTVTSSGGHGMNFASNGGLLELSGTLSTTVDSARWVSFGGTGNGLVSGTIEDGSGGKSFAVRKSDSGTWTLSNDNTYTNLTRIFDGTLLVNGSNSGGGSYTVDTTGTLGGIGSIAASAVWVNGALAPGASVGTLAVTGPVTFTNTGTLRIELDESQSGFVDLLDIDGNLSITSGAEIDFSVAGALTQSEYIFGTYTGTLTGLFTSSTIPVGYLLEQGSGVLKLTAVPEPGALALAMVGLMFLGFFRRSGWKA